MNHTQQKLLCTRHRIALLLIACLLPGLRAKALFSIPSGLSGYSYSCVMLPTSAHNTAGIVNPNGGFGGYLFDDGLSNIYSSGPGYPPTSVDNNTYWNCGRQYAFAEYTGTGSIVFDFEYQGYYPAGSPPVPSHDIRIYNSGNVLLYTASGYADKNHDGTDHTFSFPSTLDGTPGRYIVKYYRAGWTPGIDSPDISFIVVLQPPVRSLTITAPVLCSETFTSQYNFQVTSVPNFGSVMQQGLSSYAKYGYVYDATTGTDVWECDYSSDDIIPEVAYALSVSATGYSLGTLANANWYNDDLYGGPNNWQINGVGYTNALDEVAGGTLSASYLDFNDYWLTPSQLSLILPGGGSYGTPSYLSATFTDGIANTPSALAPLIVNTPVRDIMPSVDAIATYSSITMDGFSYWNYYGPPNAVGIPWNAFDIYDYTLQGSEIWTPTNNPLTSTFQIGSTSTINIQDNIHIPAGCKLTLQGMTLNMGPGSHIYIDNATTSSHLNGGELYVDNSTITNYKECEAGGAAWGGIYVWGDPTQPQNTIGHTVQGSVQVVNNSTISNADTAILAGTNDPGITTPKGGGIVNVNASTVQDNLYGVVFTPYANRPAPGSAEIRNMSSFTNSNFELSDWLPPSSLSIPLVGIAGWNVKGIDVMGCNFTTNLAHLYNTYGIYGVNMGFTVDQTTTVIPRASTPSTFQNFNHAIYHISTGGSNTATVRNSTFSNNYVGIELSGSPAPEVYNNAFDVPAYYSTAWLPTFAGVPQTVGVLLMGASGYTVSNNNFAKSAHIAGSAEDYHCTGVLVSNTGGSDNYIKENAYSSLGAGNLSNYKNTNSSTTASHGLQFLCNTNTGNGFDISAVGHTHASATEGIDYLQGTTSHPAGNTFSTDYNLYNEIIAGTESVSSYNYYYSTAGSAYEHPGTAPTGGVTGTDYGSILYLVPGPVVYSTSTADGCTTAGATLTVPYIYPALPGNVAPLTPGDPRRLPMVFASITHYMNDTDGIPHRDSLYYWTRQIQTPAGDMMLANLYVEDSNIDSANTIYDSIVHKYPMDSTEMAEYNQWGRQLMDINIYHRQYGSIGASQISQLAEIREGATTWGQTLAADWLLGYAPGQISYGLNYASGHGYVMADTLLYPDPQDSSDQRRSSPINPTTMANIKNIIFPNPANDIVQVSYQSTSSDAISIEIDGIDGKQLISQQINSGISTIDVHILPSGSYLYKVLEGSIVRMKGVLIKQ